VTRRKCTGERVHARDVLADAGERPAERRIDDATHRSPSAPGEIDLH